MSALSANQPMLRNPAILATESDPLTRELYQMLFDDCCKLTMEADPRRLLDQALENPPDLVLLNLEGRGFSGLDLCRALRSREELREVPILMITARYDKDTRLEALDAGVDDFLAKPFDLLEFSSRVNAILRLNRFRQIYVERAKFEWMATSSPQGILVLDENLQVRFANPKAAEWLQLPARGLKGTRFIEHCRSLFICRPTNSWEALTEGHLAGGLHLVQPDSTARPTQQQMPLFESHRMFRWIGLKFLELNYGTERRWLVYLEDRTAEYRQDQDLWSLRNVLSHKLRTPFNGLLGPLEFLKDYGESLSSEDRTQFIETAYESSQRLFATLENIWNFFSLSAQETVAEPASLGALYGIVSQVAEQLELEQPQYSSPVPPPSERLCLSRLYLEGICAEILSNAKRFHPKESPQMKVVLSLDTEKGEGIIRFIDDGIWLKPSQLERILLPFYQAEEKFTGEVVGEGLGLASVARLLWSCGGDIQLENRSGRPGVIVRLSIPLVARNSRQSEMPMEID